MNRRVLSSLICALLTLASGLRAATYEVGPGKDLAAIGDVPWESLQPGDTVLIHARPQPYREKFVLCRAGMAAAPISVRGVPDAAGNLPVLDGENATTRTNLDFWGDRRSIIKIGGAKNPPDTMPAWIIIDNLDIRNARPAYKFTDANGRQQTYAKNAAAITVEKCEHLVIRNCRIHDSGNGLFISSNDERASRNILIEGNQIFDNGIEGSGQEHNTYTAAVGIVFKNNRFGPLRAGCLGNNLKDRSAGLVVQGNWIEGGNKSLDLVDAQDSALIRNAPEYRDSFVHDNVILKQPVDGHSFIVHYGGDGDKLSTYRKGTLHFYNNTVIYYRRGPTILLRLSSNEEHCRFWNNIVYTVAAGERVSVLENKGSLDLSHNWFKTGWKIYPTKKMSGPVRDDGTSLTGETPGFRNFEMRDFRLAAKSPCRRAGVIKDSVSEEAKGNIIAKPDLGAFQSANMTE